jgi:hypothetical protein
MNLTEVAAKQKAIEQYIRRTKIAKSAKISNENLPAGSAMFFYCGECGLMVEKLPEDYIFPPHRLCSQCKGLIELGWESDARAASKFSRRIDYAVGDIHRKPEI